jgi:AraC-like DNA-binding protein
MAHHDSAREAPRATFLVGKGYALFEGPAGDNTPHRHAAFQVSIALEGELTIQDEAGLHVGSVLVVPPLHRHQLLATSGVRAYFVEPHCRFADLLRQSCGNGVTAAPELRALGEQQLRALGESAAESVDPRLRRVLMALSAPEESRSIPELAREEGLSAQRLRALAQEQLGMPLVRWRIWQRFLIAARTVARGGSLAEAALAAGFSDQAHMSREMRKMFGISPSKVLPLLRGQDLFAT